MEGTTTRRRVVVMAAAAAAAMTLGVVAVALATRSGEALLSLAPLFDVGPATIASPPPGEVLDQAHTATVIYRDGAVVRYVFALHNEGPDPLVVTEVVAPPPSSVTLLRPVAMGLAQAGKVLPYSVGTSPGETLNADENLPDIEPFHAFTLAPGEDRAVYVWARMGNCEYNSPGSSETLDVLKIHYTVRGDLREAELRLPMGIRVTVPVDLQCPRTRPIAGLGPSPAGTPLPVPAAHPLGG